jgi:putative ABC transport system ATP-binding protein
MELLKDLHAEGATICMVTHDSRFTAYAERNVHLWDGRIISEAAAAERAKLAETCP